MTVKRAVRVAERLREDLAARVRDLADPRLLGAIVSRVEMPDDLSIAKVYVRREQGADDAAKKALVKGMSSASARLRRDIARSLSLRYTPELRFFYDDAPDAHTRVEEILREIERDKKHDDDE